MMEGGVELTEHGFANLAMSFELLSQASQERWLSLTYKMGHEQAEELVHAMCLILLKRRGEAHAKLTANNSSVGSFLAEIVTVHGVHLNASHIGGFNTADARTFLDIARIYAILVQEGLCNKTLRDQAYRAALASDLHSLDVLEEVKRVCGPDAIGELATEINNLSSFGESARNGGHASCSESSPSSFSLEISSPTTTESSLDESEPLSVRTPTDSKATASIRSKSQREMAEFSSATSSKQCLDREGSSQLVTSKNTNLGFSSSPHDGAKLPAQPVNTNDHEAATQTKSIPSPAASQSNEDETFYAFVILHEPEDTDEAQRLRDRLERIIGGVGATFSDDFEQAGKSSLRCLEDAIENSAFTLLLLTQNFKSNLGATSADSAIVNSLENNHKMNTVIPLLPRENRLSRKDFPLVLQTKVPLDESKRTFERSAIKAIRPELVENVKKVWLERQHIKKLKKEQQRLQEENVRNDNLRQETEKLARLRLQQEMQRGNRFHPASATQHGTWQQPPSCIHIENAQNVMIGNHSTMNIDHANSLAD